MAALAGYAHLRAQAPPAAIGGGGETAVLTAAIQRELQPIVDRLERLEERLSA